MYFELCTPSSSPCDLLYGRMWRSPWFRLFSIAIATSGSSVTDLVSMSWIVVCTCVFSPFVLPNVRCGWWDRDFWCVESVHYGILKISPDKFVRGCSSWQFWKAMGRFRPTFVTSRFACPISDNIANLVSRLRVTLVHGKFCVWLFICLWFNWAFWRVNFKLRNSGDCWTYYTFHLVLSMLSL